MTVGVPRVTEFRVIQPGAGMKERRRFSYTTLGGSTVEQLNKTRWEVGRGH